MNKYYKNISNLLKCMIISILMSVSITTHAFENSRYTDSPIVIFISFSMPSESIKMILQDAAKINAPVVLRGFVDHSFQKTAAKLNEYASDNNQSIQIDPQLFSTYEITKVPAVLIQNKKSTKIFYGDVILDNILSHAARNDNDVGTVAARLLNQLRS